MSVLFTDRHDHTERYPSDNGSPDVPNFDVQTIYFSGHEIPSLYHVEQQAEDSKQQE